MLMNMSEEEIVTLRFRQSGQLSGMLMSMSEEKIVTLRFETADHGLTEIDVPADVAEAIDRGQDAVTTLRGYDQRHYTGEEARERIRAWLDGFRGGGS
jgi:hypothetical protein